MKIYFEKDDMLSPKEIPDSNNGQGVMGTL